MQGRGETGNGSVVSQVTFHCIYIYIYIYIYFSLVVKALDYKPEGRGFETRWGEILKVPNPSSPTRPRRLFSL
jgi:hypothetical protein